jgi:hypothetical protein
MSKPLTADLILQRTKAGSLDSVKNLNLWGNDIDDVRILKEMPNIEVLSLSVNKISSLKPFQYCKKLTELYLRKNLIADLSEIKFIQPLPGLKVLWLWDNPCAEVPNYRETVLAALPNLVKLDNQAVTMEERTQCSALALPVGRNRRDERKEEEIGKREREKEREKEKEKEILPAVKEIPRSRARRDVSDKMDNVLVAVLALVKELDDNSLEVVRRDVGKRLNELNNR